MSAYILILIVRLGVGDSVSMARFDNRLACENALRVATMMANFSKDMKGTCVPAGIP